MAAELNGLFLHRRRLKLNRFPAFIQGQTLFGVRGDVRALKAATGHRTAKLDGHLLKALFNFASCGDCSLLFCF